MAKAVPGKLGEVVPRRKTLRVPQIGKRETPMSGVGAEFKRLASAGVRGFYSCGGNR